MELRCLIGCSIREFVHRDVLVTLVFQSEAKFVEFEACANDGYAEGLVVSDDHNWSRFQLIHGHLQRMNFFVI